MLKVDNIYVNYGNFEALSGVSLEIKEGEIVALLGSNGAGKTTTINTISGNSKLMSGDIVWKGRSIKNMPMYNRVSLGIVQVPEGRKLFPYMSIQENLFIGSYLKQARKQRNRTLEMCYELFPKLAERKHQLAGSLSGGEQQMCAIARGLMQQPELLMLDEPSLGLAPVVVDQIFSALKKINEMGTTILLVEQNVMLSLEIATQAYVIELGKNVMQGNCKELINNPDLKKAYLGL